MITGRVCWRGEVPRCPPFEAQGPGHDGKWRTTIVRNPFAPVIDSKSKAVAGAVVFLEAVPPERSRPWDHGAVQVVAAEHAFEVKQGDGPPQRVGFVRRGDQVIIDSARAGFESVVARGAAFFSLPFPLPNDPLRRKLTKPGIVEITSGAGRFWLRAHLFVTEHPYYCRTDAAGRFTLAQVPPGEYRLICWLPNPKVVQRDRDPNMGQVIRHQHAPAFQRYQVVEVAPRTAMHVEFRIGE